MGAVTEQMQQGFKGCCFMHLLFSSKNSKWLRRRDISSNSKPKRNVWVQPYPHHLVWNHSRYISFFQLNCQETFAELLCLLSSAVYSRTRTFLFWPFLVFNQENRTQQHFCRSQSWLMSSKHKSTFFFQECFLSNTFCPSDAVKI